MLTQRNRLGTGLVVVLVAAVTLPYSFSGDIRYEMGVKEVSGHNAADTFTHRPLLYRLVSAAITAPAQALGSDVGEVEVILRAECAALGLLAGLLLWTGLRHRLNVDASAVSPWALSSLRCTASMSAALSTVGAPRSNSSGNRSGS